MIPRMITATVPITRDLTDEQLASIQSALTAAIWESYKREVIDRTADEMIRGIEA